MPPPLAPKRPIERFAQAAARCRNEASEYGKCVVKDYNNVSKDKCLVEFMRLKQCLAAAYKKR